MSNKTFGNIVVIIIILSVIRGQNDQERPVVVVVGPYTLLLSVADVFNFFFMYVQVQRP